MNMEIDRQSRSFSNSKRRVKSLAHYTQNCKKFSYLPYTLELFFTTATIFSTVSYIGNEFHNYLFKKNLCSFKSSVLGP